MKIIINKCYGGFTLSFFACKELLKRKGKECYFYEEEFRKGYTKVDYNSINVASIKDYIWVIVSTKDYGKSTKKIEREHLFNNGENLRTDFDLITMIEELGSEKCSGLCSELKVVEIPDNVEWEIEEYDGIEWISEKHRTWE